METPKTTAKDFFLWAGAIVSFYWSVIAFIMLTFDYINYAFPNLLSYYVADPYQSGISYEMASVIVLLPIYLVLTLFIHKNEVVDPSRKEIWVRRWAVILTLFVAGIAMAADFITLLTTFLNGEELTLAFMLKVAIILLVAGGVFMHFIADLKGYWDLFPKRRNMVRIGVAILAAATIVAGFFIVGTPSQARLARYDAQKVSDLQDIQQRILNYYKAKQVLPVALTDFNALEYGPVPVDQQTGGSYVYQSAGALSFSLCATFNTASRMRQILPEQPVDVTVPAGTVARQDNWQHGAGKVCYSRTIDPSFYPPIK